MKKISKCIAVLLIVAAVCCFAVPVNDYVQTKNEYDEITDEVVTVKDNGLLDIDWNTLLSINDRIIAWIDIPETAISYPIMCVEDNNEYLRRNVRGKSSRSGVIFADSETITPFEGCNTIVYGHNMLNDQMFSQIKNYRSEEYMREHSAIYVYLPDGRVLEYQAFSFMYADMYDMDIYDVNVSSDELSGYYDMISDRSIIYTKVKDETNVLTLSTCANSVGQGKRSVVHACFIKELIDD